MFQKLSSIAVNTPFVTWSLNLFFESNEDMREVNFRLNTYPEESQYWNHIDYGAFQ